MPKLIPNTGHLGVAYSRSALRIVPSPPSTRQRSGVRRASASGSSPSPPPRRACRRSSSVGEQPAAGPLARPRPRRADRGRGLLGLGVGETTAVRTSAPRRSARSRLHRPDRRLQVARCSTPGRVAWTKVSGCPSGPGSPDEAKPAHRRARHPRSRAPPRAAPRGDRPGRGPRPPAHRPWPSSNCGLTIASSSPPGARQPATAGSTLASEMNETSTVASPRPVRAARRGRARARCCARSPSPGDRFAGPSRAGRGRRRARSLARRRAASRQSVKPPVEAPTSRQSSPADVDRRARRARSRA